YADSADGNYRTNTATTGQANALETSVTNGTQTVTVLDRAGHRLSEKTFDVTSGLLTSSTLVTQSDDLGRPTVVQYLDGSTETTVYGCCGIESVTDREGSVTTYDYDDLKRPML